MTDGFIGEIRMFAGAEAPENWAFCQGQSLPVSDNQALYSLIGTTYGGDGVSVFMLPDLRGRVPIGQGTGVGLTPRTIGATGGTEQVGLTEAKLPIHSHDFLVSTEISTSTDPQNNAYGSFPTSFPTMTGLYTATIQGPGISKQTFAPGFLSSEGGNQPHPNVMPSMTVNFIIALTGNYPQRPA